MREDAHGKLVLQVSIRERQHEAVNLAWHAWFQPFYLPYDLSFVFKAGMLPLPCSILNMK